MGRNTGFEVIEKRRHKVIESDVMVRVRTSKTARSKAVEIRLTRVVLDRCNWKQGDFITIMVHPQEHVIRLVRAASQANGHKLTANKRSCNIVHLKASVSDRLAEVCEHFATAEVGWDFDRDHLDLFVS